jgi:glyoxylase-like metal-dependent hydrolase (beta-lactamase superfamily II)
MEQQRLGPRVTVLFGESHGKYPDGNTVVVDGDDRTAVIDPSLSSRNHDLGPIDVVLLTHTHEDHTAGLSALDVDDIKVHHRDLAALHSIEGLMNLYGLAGEARQAMARYVIDGYYFEGWPQATGLDDGELVDLGGVTVRVVHAPGHTGGHSVMVIEGADQPTVAVVGDIDLTSFGPYYGDAASDLGEFRATLASVRTLPADHYVTFHHKGIVDGSDRWVAAVDAFASPIERRTAAIRHMLSEPKTIDQMADVGIIYRPGTTPPVFGRAVEVRSLGLHLDEMVASGEVQRDGDWFALRG